MAPTRYWNFFTDGIKLGDKIIRTGDEEVIVAVGMEFVCIPLELLLGILKGFYLPSKSGNMEKYGLALPLSIFQYYSLLSRFQARRG